MPAVVPLTHDLTRVMEGLQCFFAIYFFIFFNSIDNIDVSLPRKGLNTILSVPRELVVLSTASLSLLESFQLLLVGQVVSLGPILGPIDTASSLVLFTRFLRRKAVHRRSGPSRFVTLILGIIAET